MGRLRRVARARLASQVIRRLRRAGVTDARYDAATFSIRFTPTTENDPGDSDPDQGYPDQGYPGENDPGDSDPGKDNPSKIDTTKNEPHEGDPSATPTVIELGGLLADRSGSRRERRARVDRFVAGFLRTPGVPDDWNRACPLLRSVLRGGTPVAAGIGAPLHRPALPYLAEFVVVDQPDTMTYVSADQLAGWGVNAGEVYAAARGNLTGAVLNGVAHEPTVVQFLDDGDAYWTSHLLLDGWLGRLAGQVGGVPVAFAPERGTLLVAADGSAQLPALFAQAEAVYASSPRAITPMAYVSGERGRTIPYPAPEGHPLHHVVRRAEALLAATEYARQAETLPGNPVELLLVGSAAEGWRTRAVWRRDEPALLPLADEVLLGDGDSDQIRPWASIVTHLTPASDLDPPRWHATAWPP